MLKVIRTNSLEAVEWKWYSSATSVGVVLCENAMGQQCCYIGAASGTNEEYDVQQIMNFGAKVEKPVAEAVFNPKLENYKW